jgi:uncharacterized protein
LISRSQDDEDPDLAELGALLTSDRARPGCLSLSALDGFLAAVLAGPERVSPEEWLPMVWGEGEPAWADRDEAWRVFDAIRARHDQVDRQLEEDPDAYAPIFRTLHDGTVTAADWARGFLMGVDLRPSRWDALTASAEGMRYFVTIVSQLPDWDKRIKVVAKVGSAKIRGFRREGRRFIPLCVVEIRRFWSRRCGGGRARREVGCRPMVN